MDAKELKEKIDSVVVKYNEKPKDGEYGVISLMNEINDLIEENGAFHTLKGAENPLIYEMFYLNSILKWNKTYKHKVSLLESYFNEEIYKVSMNQNIFNSLPKSKRENVNKLTLNSYEPTDKSMKDLMSVFCSTDDLRPALMGANYNELGVVSTDAYKMLFLNKKDNKYKKDVTKCVTDYCVKSHKKLGITESQFPNWKSIIPTKDYANLDFVFDVDALFSYLTICLNFGLFYKGGVGERDAVVTFDFIKNNNSDDSIFSFNIEYLLDCLKGLIKLGISEARINYSSPSKAIVFTDAKVIEKDFLNQNLILLMPVMTGDMFKNYYFDFKTNSVVYGKKKYEFPIGIEDKVQKEINTCEYKDVKINITLDELSNYPKIKDKLSKLSDSKLKKSISGGCSTNYNIGSNTYSCKYNIIEVENETNIEKKESISTIYNIEILNGTFGNQDVSHDVERKVLEYFGRIKKVEEVKSENKKETPTESKPNNDVFDATKLDVNNSISSRVYSKGVDNEINKILQNDYTSVYDFDKKGIEWIYKNTRYNVKNEDLTLELKGALIERNVGVVDTMRINNELPRIESKYGKDVNLAKRMYKEAKDFYESKLRNEKSIRANEVFIDYLISRLKETKKEETPTESKSDLEFLNEMLKTSKNLLDLISDTGNKEDVDYLKKKIETTKNLISLLPIDEKKKFELGGIFHGSPYQFDRFFTSKIGSGIGQQDDGWGLYLTNDKDGAKNYGKYIYETTLFKGKKPNEYNFLELKKPVPKDLVKKIVEAVYKYYNKEFDINKFNSYYDYVKNESLPKVDFNDFELIRFDYGGYLFYKTLSRTLGGDKKASLFLLDNGIDGLKVSLVEYGVNYRTDYIIFDENAITIEKTEYLPHNYYEVGGGVFLAPNGKPSNLTPEQYKLVRTNEFKEWFGDWENDPANASKVIDKETKEPLLVYHGTNNDFTVFDKSKLGSKNFFAESSYLGFFFASNIKTSEAYIGMNTMDMAGVSFGAYDDVLNEYNPTMEDIQRDIKKVYEEISEKYKKEELDKAKEKSPFSEKIRDAGFTEEEWFKYQKEYAERQIDWNKISELSKEENDSNGNNQKYNELKDLMYNKIEEKWKVITNSNPRIIKLFLNIREPHIVDYRDNDITELSFDIKNAIEYKKDGVIFNNLKDGADVDDIFVAFESNQIKLADGTNTTFDSNNSDIRFDGGGFVISEEKGEKFIKKLSELDCDKPLTNFQMNFFGFLDSLKDDCISLGGFWYDSNTTNYGYSKMGRIVLFDIEDFYNEKERTAFIEENYPTSTPLEIQPFDDDNYEFIGIGEASMGGVFRDKRDGSILKLTASPFEVVGTTKILNAQKKDIQYEDNFAEIYSIQNIGKGVFKGTWHYKYYNEREWSGNWFAIRREDITPFNEQEQKEANCVKEIIVNYYSMFDNKNYQPEIFGSYDIYEPNREFQYLLRKRNKYSDGGDTKSNTTFDSNNPDIRFDGGGKATNYTEFFDRLKIEDGTKYIGQKFGDVFPFLKGSFSTPFKYKLRVKQYNDYLKRLSEDNYTTKAMKQRDLNKIENNKGRINKVKYLSEFVCDSTGTIIDFKHNTDVRFADGGSVSTSRFYATKEVDNWNDIPSTWKNINKVNKVNLKLDPNDDKFNSIFKKFLSTDELRPVMMGYNVDENGITCTNAHILAVIPTKENLQKGIFLNGKEIDGKYPNYSAVIPKDGFKSTSIVDTYKLLQYCNVALNYSDKYSFGCNFNTENGVMTFNLKLLTTILETSLKLGYEELYFKFKESNSSVVISNVKEPILGKDIILLLFPMSNRGSEFKGTQNLDYDLELTCYFDFTKNEIINKDNSIVDFEMNYGENPVFTKEIISHLKLNIDTKTRLPILDNFLVEDKKIRLVNLDNNTTLLIKDVDAPTGLYYIQNNVAVYSDISIDDYPKKSPFFNDKPKAINKVNISSEYFKWILDVLNSSKGDDDLRPVMTGLNISYDGSELLFASTNGHSLGVIKANENVSFENKNNFNEIINFGKISDLINFKKDSNVVIEFYQEGNFKIITDGFDIVSKVIDGTYPNYYGVIPKNSSNKLTINNKKLIDALSSKEAQSFIKKVPSSKGATYSSLNILGEEKDGQLVISLVQTELYYRSDKEEKVLDSKVIYTDDLIFDNDANIETTDSCILLMPMQTKEPHLFYFNFSLFNKFIKPVNTQSFDLLFNNGTGKPYVVNSNNFDYTQKTSKKEVSKLKEVKAVSLKPKKQIPAESNSDLEYLKGLLSTSKDLLDLISITGNKEDIDYLKEKIKVTKTLISLIE